MSKALYKIKEMVCDELDNIAKKGELSAGSLETVDKLTHTLKSLVTVMAMEDYDESGMSYDGANGGNMGGMSGARGRTGNVRRDSMGRYSREGGYSGRRGGYSREGGMSYDGARDELMEHVDELMGMASDEPTKQMIRRFKSELEKS